MLPASKYSALPQQQALLPNVLERLSALPDVTAATLGTPPPSELAGTRLTADREHEPEPAPAAAILRASPDYQVTPRDPLAVCMARSVFVLVSLTAAWAPARRATRVDAIVALSAE